MKTRNLLITFLGVILLGVAINFLLNAPEFECQDKLGCVTIKPKDPLKIALIQSRSGRLKSAGDMQIRGVQLALSRRDNKILGHPVELQIEDSRCSPEGGAVSALKIGADPQIVAIVGTTCSGSAIPASRIMSETGLVMISGSNSAASLTSRDGVQGADWNPGYFRTMYNAIGRGETGALFARKKLGLLRAATIHDGDTRSMELTQLFEKTFTELGGEIVLSTMIDRKDVDMRPVLIRAATVDTQIIFAPFFPPEVVHLTQQVREVSGLERSAIMVCGTSVRTDTFINSVGDAGKGMYFVGKVLSSGPMYDELNTAYEAKYTDPHDDLYAFAFDAANILFAALETVLEKESNGTLHLGRQALRDAMYSTADFEGVTGTLNCDRFGDCGIPTYNILQLDDPKSGIKGLLKKEVFKYTSQ